jgi:glycosyltransferase involved in cell wall biosynthesis
MQGLQTWRVLRRERPEVVFVHNPPIFCPLVAALYALWHGAHYVIDSHTGAFLSSRWRWSLGLHRILSQGALATIVHNEHQGRIVAGWGCRFLVLADPLGEYPAGEPFPYHRDSFNVAVVSSFLPDEPVEIVFEAARQLTGVSLYFTGDSSRLDSRLLAEKPDNCFLTGYLPDEQYVGLLRSSDAVMALTTRNHTLLSGAFEAVSLGTPLITSDWPVLRNRFPLGTLHASNTVEGICEGVRRAQREHAALQHGIRLLREQLQTEWEQRFTELQHLLQEHHAESYGRQ